MATGIAITVTVVLLLGACGPGDGSGQPPLSSSGPASPAPSGSPRGQATLDRVRSALAPADGLLGGIYLSDSGAVVHVLVTRDLAKYRSELPPLAEPGITVEVEAARYPLVALERVLERIADQQAALRNEGILVAGIAVDEQRNRVLVTLEKRTPDLERTLRARFGDSLIFEEGTASAN